MSPTIPTHCNAAYLEALGSKYEVRSLPVASPGPGQVLVAVTHSGLCHSDIMAYTPPPPESGALQPIRPLVGGHEGVGRIVALGEGVEAKGRRKVGDLVGMGFLGGTCGHCEACASGNENVCPKASFNGFTRQGTFSEYAVANADNVIPIPESITPEQACPILCAGVTVYKGLKLASPLAGQWVVVPGAGGGLGHLAVQYARVMGLRVIGIDSTAKKDLVLRCGAEHFLDYTTGINVVEEVIKLTDGGAHISIVAVAHPSGYEQALAYARVLGKVVCVGLTPFGLHSAQIIGRGLTVYGSMVGTRVDAEEALAFVARGLVKCEIVLKELDELDSLIDELEKGKVQGRIVIKVAG